MSGTGAGRANGWTTADELAPAGPLLRTVREPGSNRRYLKLGMVVLAAKERLDRLRPFGPWSALLAAWWRDVRVAATGVVHTSACDRTHARSLYILP